jgi:hypothetical protein
MEGDVIIPHLPAGGLRRLFSFRHPSESMLSQKDSRFTNAVEAVPPFLIRTGRSNNPSSPQRTLGSIASVEEALLPPEEAFPLGTAVFRPLRAG